MSNAVNIDIQRSGFPIKVAGVEFWFDMSLEHTQKFFSVEELAAQKLAEAQAVVDAMESPEELTVEGMDAKNAKDTLFVHKEFVKALYDITLGDGSFDQIYAVIPDVMALEDHYPVLGVAIAQRVGEDKAMRDKATLAKMKKYTDKKKAKR